MLLQLHLTGWHVGQVADKRWSTIAFLTNICEQGED